MDLMQIRRSLLLPFQRTIGGIPVWKDNCRYSPSNGAADSYIDDPDYFLTGVIDTGNSTETKLYTFSRIYCPNGAAVRFFNDLSATSSDYWTMMYQTTPYGHIIPYGIEASYRYIICSVAKAYAADFYIAMNGSLILRGNNVNPIYHLGGLPVLFDNAYYANSNGTIDSVVPHFNYFIAGPFDTGSTGNKQYTLTRTWATISVAFRLFNDLTATSFDYWTINASSVPSIRTLTSGGRYVAYTVHKGNAGDMYMHDDTNGRYVFKGEYVT